MVYQLPNGKVINITLDEFLELTDDDIQYLMSVDAGEFASSPFYGSGTRSPGEEDAGEEFETLHAEDMEFPDFGDMSFTD